MERYVMDNAQEKGSTITGMILPGNGYSSGLRALHWQENVYGNRDNYYFNRMHYIPIRFIAILLLLASIGLEKLTWLSRWPVSRRIGTTSRWLRASPDAWLGRSPRSSTINRHAGRRERFGVRCRPHLLTPRSSNGGPAYTSISE